MFGINFKMILSLKMIQCSKSKTLLKLYFSLLKYGVHFFNLTKKQVRNLTNCKADAKFVARFNVI